MSMKGFTLLETLVAVAILTLAVSGPLYVANRALVAAQNSQSQLTASYLAQEGIEYVRTMRDHQYLYAQKAGGSDVSDDAWRAFVFNIGGSSQGRFGQCLDLTKKCALDPWLTMGGGSANALFLCTESTCPEQLYLVDFADGKHYRRSGAADEKTIFSRTVRGELVSDESSASENLKITSTVTWAFHGRTYTVTATGNLTPWQ